MQMIQYKLHDFNLLNTPCTYPVIRKGVTSIGDKNVNVYIDSLSGFILESEAVCLRLSGTLSGEFKNESIEHISNKLDLLPVDSEILFTKFIEPSIINSSFESLNQFFNLESFKLSNAAIECNYSNGFTKGTAILNKTDDESIQIHANWSILNGTTKIDSFELIGAHTTNIHKNKYVNVLIHELVEKYIACHISNNGQ